MACDCFICKFHQKDICHRCGHTRRSHTFYVGTCWRETANGIRVEGAPGDDESPLYCLCEGFVEEPGVDIVALGNEYEKFLGL